MADVPIHYKPITELAGLIRSKRISPVEVTAEILQRIGQLDGRFKSYATAMTEHAELAAKKLNRKSPAVTTGVSCMGCPSL